MPTSASCSSIGDALDFFEGISGRQVHEATLVDFYTSHEGLHLHYEQAQTRFIPRQNRWYNLSTHMPWIGMRTAALDGAHVEFFRGISNPVASRSARRWMPRGCRAWWRTLNPQNQPGRLTFIHRFGAKDIAQRAAQGDRGGAPDRADGAVDAAIRCTATPRPRTGGIKTRRFENILKELDLAFRIHAEHGLVPRAACTSSSPARTSPSAPAARADSPTRTCSAPIARSVDPRLNHEQALELAMLIAERSQTAPRRQARGGRAQDLRRSAAAHAVRAHHRAGRGRPIRINADCTLSVPEQPIIPYIEGDGIGIDVTPAMQRVVDAAVVKAYGSARRIHWMEVYSGEKANLRYGKWFPDETLHALREFVVSIKGPLGTPIGGGMRSLNVAMRQNLDLYACVRPIRYFPGVASPMAGREPDRHGGVPREH